jgi:hypothetical protein
MLSSATPQEINLNSTGDWVEWDVAQYANVRITAFKHAAFPWVTATLTIEGSNGGGGFFPLSVNLGPPATTTATLDSGNIDTSDFVKLRVRVTTAEGNASYGIVYASLKTLQ